jgi:hypothetical protein
MGSSFAGAATVPAAGSANGMKVGPVRTDLVMNPGETKSVPVYVQNITGANEALKPLVNDFTADNTETGTPALLLNGEINKAHGLKQYISAPGTFTVAPGDQKSIDVTITLPKDIAPGGYYAAVRFTQASLSTANNVNLAASVGSLILVRVAGDVTEQMSIASFSVSKGDKGKASSFLTTNKGLQANVRFKNSGNVQEQPFGKVTLKKGSKVISSTEINDFFPRGNVLPDSIRKFTVPLKKVGSFGKYTIVGSFGYGQKSQLVTAETSFYVIPLAMIILIVVIILLILFLIFVLPRMIRNYNARVLRRAGRR